MGEFYKHWNETALLKSMDNTLARSNIKAKHVPALLAPGGRLYHDPAGIVLCVD